MDRINWYCNSCKHIVDPPDKQALSDIDKYCDKYKENLIFYDLWMRCEKCCNEHNSADDIKD